MVYQLKNDKIFYIYNITRVLNKKKFDLFTFFEQSFEVLVKMKSLKIMRVFYSSTKWILKRRDKVIFFKCSVSLSLI